MKLGILMLLATCTLIASAGGAWQNVSSAQSNPCAVINQALLDYHQLKNGISRRDVEEHFEQDGGMQFPQQTRYVYSKCESIKVDIEFKVTNSVVPFSPDDTVTKISRLYLAYPAKD